MKLLKLLFTGSMSSFLIYLSVLNAKVGNIIAACTLMILAVSLIIMFYSDKQIENGGNKNEKRNERI